MIKGYFLEIYLYAVCNVLKTF